MIWNTYSFIQYWLKHYITTATVGLETPCYIIEQINYI
jgi:hypothetical protein